MNQNIKHMFWLIFTLFVMLIIFMCKFMFFDSAEIVANSYNPRLKMADNSVKRGNIVDAEGVVLAQSSKLIDTYVRNYPFDNYFSHVVGFSDMGRAGVELKYNFELQTLNFEVVQRLRSVLNKRELICNSVVLTINSGMQQFIYDNLGKAKGAGVVIEPSTGKVLALVSKPDFNPNNIASDWKELTGDKTSPLLNRATQGLYPPGSIYKILTAQAIMQEIGEEATYECKGKETFGEKVIHCYNDNAHGTVNLKKALAVSCNTFFAKFGLEIGVEKLKTVSEAAYFNKDFEYLLEHKPSSFALNESSDTNEIVQTAIGQGKTLTSPLHMASIAAAVANGGLMMRPYVFDHLKAYNLEGEESESGKVFPKVLSQVFSFDEAQSLTDMMIEVVEIGTAKDIKLPNVSIAAKTGTAQNAAGEDHGWVVAFAPADNPKLAVCILLENSNGPKNALTIVKQFFNEFLTD